MVFLSFTANCHPEDDQYRYAGSYGNPYDGSMERRSIGSLKNTQLSGSPEPPPPPPPRTNNNETSNSSFNDSKESNEISEAECDRDMNQSRYGGKWGFF